MKLKRILLSLVVLVAATFIAATGHANHAAFYVLDGFGGVHAGGGAGAVAGIPYFGFDIAKGIVYIPLGTALGSGDGILVLDGFGGIHEGGALVSDPVAPKTPYFGFDIARAIAARNVPPRMVGAGINTGNVAVTSSSYVAMVSTSFFAPDDGNIVAMCGASIGCIGCTDASPSFTRIAVGIDSLAEVTGINREVGFTSTRFGGQSVIETLPITAGAHTVNCLIRKSSGTTDPDYFDPSVTVIYVDLNGSGITMPETVPVDGPNGSGIGQ